MADFRNALVALGEGRVDLKVLLERISQLLVQKPQLIEPMLGQLEQAYSSKLLSNESYASIKRHINDTRRQKKQPRPAAAKTRAAKTKKTGAAAKKPGAAAATTRVSPTRTPIHEEDMASEIQAALAMADQPESTAATEDFERADSLTSPGSAPASTGWAEPGGEREAPATPMDVGSVIKDRFKLLDVLGQGGMGKVYKGIDLLKEEAKDKNPYVAIKLLNEDFKRHPEAFIALQRESSRQQKLAHPNIATVYDFDRIGTSGTQVYITMELMEGQPLNSYIRRAIKPKSGLPFEKAFPIIQGLGRALEYAHERNIVHSDFKPGNSFLCNDGTVKVLDFGIARAVKNPQAGDGEKTLFDPGKLGALTPAYASLEMLEGEDPDPRDDIYALGCVAYELLTGEHPFRKMPANVARDNRLTVAPVKGLKRRQMKALAKSLAFERKDRAGDVTTWLEELEGKAQWHKNPWVLAAGAVAALCLGLIYPTINYLHQRQIGILIGDIKSGEQQFIKQELAQLEERDPRDQQRILDEARDSIQKYFEQQVAAVADAKLKRYDFPRAAQFLEQAKMLYPDSLWLKEFQDALEDRKSQLLFTLTKEYIKQRGPSNSPNPNPENLLPDKQRVEITDTLTIIATVDPQHPLLNDPLLSNAYKLVAEMELNQGRMEQALAYITAGLQSAPEDNSLIDLKKRVERQQKIAELEGQLGPALATLKTLDDYQAQSENILALAREDRKHPLLEKLAAGMKSAFDPELDRINAQGNREEAAAATEKYGTLLSGLGLGRELSNLKLAHLSGAAREAAIREIVEDSQGRMQALLQDPKIGETDWEGQIQADLQQLKSLLPPENETLSSLQEEVFKLYADDARGAAAENRFTDANDRLNRLEQWIGPTEPLIQARDSVAKAEDAFNREQERKQRLATIEENKQLLLSALKARQLEGTGGAKAILQELQKDMPADDPFLVEQIFPEFERAYLRLAADKDKQGDTEGAKALIEEGLRIVPASPKLEKAKGEYEIKGDVTFLRSTFSNSTTLADAGIRQRLEQVRNADPQRYATLVPEFTQQLAGRIEGLLAANPQQAAQLAGNASRLFPESSQLQALLEKISIPPWNETEAQLALDESRLTQAAVLLAEAPPAHPKAQELQELLRQRQEQAKQAYAAFVTARDGAGTDAKALREAEEQLRQAQGLWTDNSEYEGAAQELKRALAAAAKSSKRPRLLAREQDITQVTTESPPQQQTAAVSAAPADSPAAKETSAASDAPSEPTAAGEKLTKAEPPAPWRPIASSQACTERLAGHGRRAKALCFDMITDSLRGPLMVVIPQGSALFGGDQQKQSKQKQLSFAAPFAISKYEISVNDYNKYCHLSKACALIKEDKDLPITQISAEDAVNYAIWLSDRTGKTYRLPKVEEWEYAVWANGKQPKKDFNCRVVLGEKILKGTGLISVKSGKSNGWGLKNYLGNAQEWVNDGGGWHARGGAYSDSLSNCNPTLARPHTGAADGTTGFRVILVDIG